MIYILVGSDMQIKKYFIWHIFFNSLIEPYYKICEYCDRSIPAGKKTCPYCKNDKTKIKKPSEIDIIK